MSKLQEIWEIIKRKDYKDGDEVHVIPFNGGLMMSNTLYNSLKPKLDELPEAPTSIGDIYGVKIQSTPYLPFIYREAKKKIEPKL